MTTKINDFGITLQFKNKECVLLSDMDKEDDKYKIEEFLHPDKDSDKIEELIQPKTLTNTKYFQFNHEKQMCEDIDLQNSLFTGDKINENLILKGNNLLGLYTLSNKLSNKIDMIYIDPPYYFNKKKAADSFEYNSNFNLSTWLLFMKNRLEIARELLSEHGVIFISMSEDGTPSLKLLCDEIFGDENFISNIIWRNTGQQQNNGKNIVFVTENILCYAKKNNGNNINKVKIEDRKGIKAYRYTETEGLYAGQKFRVNPIQDHTLGKHKFTIKHKLTGKKIHLTSRVKEEDLWKLDREGMIYWGDGSRSTLPQKKKYLSTNKGVLPSNFIDGIYYEKSNQELFELFGVKNLFSYSKPKDLISYLIEIGSKKDSIILDFFAGSGTTGAATLQVNKKDNGNRKFILLEQMDYIKSITRERIIKTIYKEEIQTSFIYAELKESRTKLFKKELKSINDKSEIIPLMIKYQIQFEEEEIKNISNELNINDLIRFILKTHINNYQDYVNYTNREIIVNKEDVYINSELNN